MSDGMEGLLDKHEQRGQRIQAALMEFLSAVAIAGGRVEAIEVDDMTLREVVGRHAVLGGIVSPVDIYGPAGRVTLRRAKR